MRTHLLSLTALALSAGMAVPAAAQVNGVGVTDPSIAIAGSQALQTAYQQIGTTYQAQRTQLEQLQQQRDTLVRQFDTNNDGQMSEAEQQAAQANTTAVQQLQTLDQTINRKIDSTPAFFWVITEGNDRRTQVNAGRCYVRAQLAATAHGLSMHPLSQALQEYPEQATPYAQVHALLDAPAPRHTVQMWTRLGYAPAVGPAPRRGLEAHILKA